MEIYIIDDDHKRRDALNFMLTQVGLASTNFASVSAASPFSPDMVILVAGEDQTRELIENLIDQMVPAPVIAYDHRPGTFEIVRFIAMGVTDFFDMPFDFDGLKERIFKASRNPSQLLVAQCRAAAATKRIGTLSPREIEVLSHLCAGMTNRDIAEKLEISYRTVEVHRGNMLKKLGKISSAQAIRLFSDMQALQHHEHNDRLMHKAA